MEKEGVNLQVSDKIVTEIVQQKIEMEIIKAMDFDKEALMQDIVEKTLNKKVNLNGDVSNYSNENKYNYIDILFRNKIKDLTGNILKEYIESNTTHIKSEIEKQLIKNKKSIANGLIKGLVETTKSNWKFNVDINLPQD